MAVLMTWRWSREGSVDDPQEHCDRAADTAHRDEAESTVEGHRWVVGFDAQTEGPQRTLGFVDQGLKQQRAEPLARTGATTPIANSGVASSTKTYPGSASGRNVHHAAPSAGPSPTTKPTSPSPGQPAT